MKLSTFGILRRTLWTLCLLGIWRIRKHLWNCILIHQPLEEGACILPHRWSTPCRLPCYVFCIGMLILQEVGTPYMWRTFTNTAPKARKGQLDQFFLQKRHFIYILSLKILKTGQKADKITLKTLFFPTPLTIWLSLAWFVAQHFRPGLIRCATFQARPDLMRKISGLA